MRKARVYWNIAMFIGRISNSISRVGGWFFDKWTEEYLKEKEQRDNER